MLAPKLSCDRSDASEAILNNPLHWPMESFYDVQYKRNHTHIVCIPSSLSYKLHLSRQWNCWSLRCCCWSIACRRCSNYIFILDLTLGFNRLSNETSNEKRNIYVMGFRAPYIRGFGYISWVTLDAFRRPDAGPLFTKRSYRQISWTVEAARLEVIMIVSLWNLSCISAALLLLRRLSNQNDWKKFKPESHGFQTSRDLVRCPSVYWIEALELSHQHGLWWR